MVEIFHSSVCLSSHSAIIHLIRRLAWFWMDIFISHTQHTASKKIHFDLINICEALSTKTLFASNVHLSYCRSFYSPACCFGSFSFVSFRSSSIWVSSVSLFDVSNNNFWHTLSDFAKRDETEREKRTPRWQIYSNEAKFSQSSNLPTKNFTIFSINIYSKLYLFSFIRQFNHLIKHPIFIFMLLSTTLPGVNFQLVIGFVLLCSIPQRVCLLVRSFIAFYSVG